MTLPKYARINTLRANKIEVLQILKQEGYSILDADRPMMGLPETPRRADPKSPRRIRNADFPIYIDKVFNDMVMLPSFAVDDLEKHRLFREGMLVQQDRNASVGPRQVGRVWRAGKDIIDARAGSGASVPKSEPIRGRDSSCTLGPAHGQQGQAFLV